MLTRLDKGEEGKKGKRVKGKGKGNGEKQRFAKRSQFNCQKWRSPSRRLCRSALPPYPFPFYPLHLFGFYNHLHWVFLRGKCLHLGSRGNQPGPQDEYS